MAIEKHGVLAINVVKNTSNINEIITSTPLLFYWDGEQDIKEALLDNNLINEILTNNLIDKNFYITAKILYAGFVDNEIEDEYYINDSINFQQLYTLEYLSQLEQYKSFYISFIKDYLTKLYYTVFNKDYDIIRDVFNENNILDIYNQIKNKYKERISTDTFINYIRSELNKKIPDNINEVNINYCINKLNELIIKND